MHTDHINQPRVTFSSGQLMVLGQFHHSGHDVQVKVRCRPTAPKSFVSSCGSNPPFNYCGTKRVGATLGYTHEKQIAGSLRLCMHASIRVCVFLYKSSGSLCGSQHCLSLKEFVYVSTGLWLCLEIDDCIRKQDSPSDSTSTADTCSFTVSH